MTTAVRLGGLALITVAALAIAGADRATFAALGVAFLFGVGFTGFALCVGAGQITAADRNEANGLDQPYYLDNRDN